jgi:hypothetical protein
VTDDVAKLEALIVNVEDDGTDVTTYCPKIVTPPPEVEIGNDASCPT